MPDDASLSQAPLADALRRLFDERFTGRGTLDAGEGRRQLLFVDGELHLDAVDPLAERLADLSRPTSEILPEMAAALEPLIAELATFSGDFHLEGASGELPEDRVGPLPTAYVIRELAVHGKEDAEILSALGGRHAALVLIRSERAGRTRIDDLEAHLREIALGLLRPRRISRILDEAESAPGERLRDLARLFQLGLIGPSDRSLAARDSPLTPATKKLFLDRIGRELQAEPIDMGVERHRAQVAELFRAIGVLDYYQLFGVDRHAEIQEIHEAYRRVARITHPGHAATLSLSGREASLEVVFEWSTEAYLTLSNPDRRRIYDRLMAPEEGGPSSEQRREEKRSIARELFARAQLAYFDHDFQDALELLEQAVGLDPQGKSYALMGEILMRNPQWVDRGLAAYRDAVRCAPNEAKVRLAYAHALEKAGDLRQADVQYKTVLEQTPGDGQALAGIARLEQQQKRKGGKNLLDGLRGLLR